MLLSKQYDWNNYVKPLCCYFCFSWSGCLPAETVNYLADAGNETSSMDLVRRGWWPGGSMFYEWIKTFLLEAKTQPRWQGLDLRHGASRRSAAAHRALRLRVGVSRDMACCDHSDVLKSKNQPALVSDRAADHTGGNTSAMNWHQNPAVLLKAHQNDCRALHNPAVVGYHTTLAQHRVSFHFKDLNAPVFVM